MIGVYIRVSTYDQKPDSQQHEIERWLDGNNVPASSVRWFVDRATGDDLQRRGFEELQTSVFNGEIKTVVVWKLDRLSRCLRDGINVLTDWCDRELRVVSVTQQIDFNGAIGKMLAAVLLGVAEMEQEIRRERQAAGIAVAKRRGVYKGRQRGTTKAAPSRAIELKQRGLSVSEVASAMGVSTRTVRRYLAAGR